MKKLLLFIFTLLSIYVSSICFAEKYAVDTDRWIELKNNPSRQLYLDKKSIEVDKANKTVSLWLLSYVEAEDYAFNYKVLLNYNNKTYSLKSSVLRKISDGSITYKDTPIYSKEEAILPESLYESLYDIFKNRLEETEKDHYTYTIENSGITIKLPENYTYPLTRDFLDKVDEKDSFYDIKQTFIKENLSMVSMNKDIPVAFGLLLPSLIPAEKPEDSYYDFRELKKEFNSGKYKDLLILKDMVKNISESNLEAKIINIDKYIDNNCIFIIMDVIMKVNKANNAPAFFRYLTTVRNGQCIMISCMALDIKFRATAIAHSEKLLQDIQYSY